MIVNLGRNFFQVFPTGVKPITFCTPVGCSNTDLHETCGSFSLRPYNYSGASISRTLDFSKTLISQTKSCFPWTGFHCNFIPDISKFPISGTYFNFPWRFEKSKFHCRFKCDTLLTGSCSSVVECPTSVQKVIGLTPVGRT